MSQTDNTSNSKKQTLYSLQLLRAIAVLLVVLSHIRHKLDVVAEGSQHWLSWLNFGEYGVDIFFVISGFIIAYIAPRGAKQPLDMLNFMMRRIIRIVPLYYSITLVALLVWLINPALVNSSLPSSTVIWQSFAFWPSEGRFLVQSGWTLSYEMYFYILFSLTLLFGVSQYKILSGLLLFSLLTGVVLQNPEPVPGLMTSHYLLEFLAGYLFYNLASHHIGQKRELGAALIVLSVPLLVMHDQNALFSSLYYWGIPAIMMVLGFLLCEGAFKVPSFFIHTGDSSYSTYLTHILALPVITKIWFFMMPASQTSQLGFILVALASTVLIGLITFRLYEKPMGQAINKKWAARFRILQDSHLPRLSTPKPV